MADESAESLTSGHHLPSLLWASRRAGEPSAWHGHVAFAHWLVDVMRPRMIVELGTERGISFAAMCHAVAALGIPASCFAVDTWQGDAHTGHYDDTIFQSVNAFNEAHYSGFAKLLRCTFDEALGRFEPGSIDLLHIDGLHTYDAVRHDFETWLPKVSDRGVILFHDIAIRTGDFGVWKLWAELQERYPTFSFEHSAGLGVLAPGSTPPAAIRTLCGIGSPAEAEQVRRSFSVFSDVAFQSGHRDIELATLTRKVAGLQETVRRVAGELAAAGQTG